MFDATWVRLRLETDPNFERCLNSEMNLLGGDWDGAEQVDCSSLKTSPQVLWHPCHENLVLSTLGLRGDLLPMGRMRQK